MIQMTVKPDAAIEPGHQWIVIPRTLEGEGLARLLGVDPDGGDPRVDIMIPHSHEVDRAIIDLINALANVRFQSPTLVQLTLSVPRDDDNLEGV